MVALGKYDYSRWNKDRVIYTGPRPGSFSDMVGIDDLDVMNLDEILSAMEREEFLVFEYGGGPRLAAPFVLGVSSSGNPLLRAYQTEGFSRGGPAYGWRVFQVREMSMVEGFGEFFFPEEFLFDPLFPWTYKVVKIL